MAMIVKLKRRSRRYHDLTYGQHYTVLGIEADDFRILNDQGRPYLYPSRLFEVVDPQEPENWTTEFGEDGERYSYPPPLNTPGFFEDFFDSKTATVATFWRTVNEQLVEAAASGTMEPD
ncbi:MAG: hypothetical protein HY717_13355 [Planctomycetes bacterium]|nr:hypothetical protein [Planctomycetota bacterium]